LAAHVLLEGGKVSLLSFDVDAVMVVEDEQQVGVARTGWADEATRLVIVDLVAGDLVFTSGGILGVEVVGVKGGGPSPVGLGLTSEGDSGSELELERGEDGLSG
jgi:hypothetical protein